VLQHRPRFLQRRRHRLDTVDALVEGRLVHRLQHRRGCLRPFQQLALGMPQELPGRHGAHEPVLPLFQHHRPPPGQHFDRFVDVGGLFPDGLGDPVGGGRLALEEVRVDLGFELVQTDSEQDVDGSHAS
jgi:hypothetical protein